MSSSAEDLARPRAAEIPDLRLVRVATGAPTSTTTSTGRARGQAEGYAAGYFRAVQDARARAATELATAREELRLAADAEVSRREQEHRAALVALTRATEQLARRTETVTAEVTGDAAALAAALVEAVLGRELRALDGDAAACDVVGRVVAALADLEAEQAGGTSAPARVRLSPAVAGTLTDDQREHLASLGARVVPDPALGRDDALVDAGSSRVDLRLPQAVARLRAALVEEDV